MAAEKTWFLAPDFNFSPDGVFGIGSVIEHPRDPTAVLASLLSHRPPEVTLPPLRSRPESNHNHTAGNNRTFNLNLFTNVANVLSGSIDINRTRLKTISFGPVDLEITSFDGPFSADSIREIANMPEIKDHMKSTLYLRKRPVYLITGIAIAKNSFRVAKEFGTAQAVCVGASGTVPTGAVPLETGATMGGGSENTRTDEYYADSGVIVSFRCHVIQPKGQSEVKSKLFASKQAFYTGSGKDVGGEEEEEFNIQPATGDIVNMDLDDDSSFVEQEIDGDMWIAFPGENDE